MILKHKGKYAHVAVPGAMERVKKGKPVLKPSSMLEDMWQVANLFKEEDYPLLVVDTITMMGDRALRDIVAANLSPDPNKITSRPGVDVNSAPGGRIANATMPDYNTILSAMREWLFYVSNLCVTQNKALLLLGHDRIITSEDVEGVTIAAEGTIELPGKSTGRFLPRTIQTMLRLEVKRIGKSDKRVVYSEPKSLWFAKDRMGVWPDGLQWSIPRSKDREEHKREIIESTLEYWREWIEAVSEYDVVATAVVYGPPGTGKTSMAAGLIHAVYEATGDPTLLFDCDGDGTVVIPRYMTMPEDGQKETE